jgi:uncharacterized surface protein with fasciclin (FAS1) repeats
MQHFKTLIISLTAVALFGCGSSDDPVVPASDPSAGASQNVPTQTIDKVASAGGFNSLLAAATKADLAGALAAPGADLTVFAPTDAAFTRLATDLGFASAGDMVGALSAGALRNILSYHVLPTNQSGATLTAERQTATNTLYVYEGQPSQLNLRSDGTALTIIDGTLMTATVSAADVAASNGVIHVIDRVLVPPGVLNLVQIAQVNPNFSSLAGAVVQTGLQGTLSGPGTFTVFAPTNAAFAAAPAGLSVPQLTQVLTYHALGSQVLASDIPFGTPTATLNGQTIVINAGNPPAQPPSITDTTGTVAQIVATDVRASNGVLHVIDKVLIPTL